MNVLRYELVECRDTQTNSLIGQADKKNTYIWSLLRKIKHFQEFYKIKKRETQQ